MTTQTTAAIIWQAEHSRDLTPLQVPETVHLKVGPRQRWWRRLAASDAGSICASVARSFVLYPAYSARVNADHELARLAQDRTEAKSHLQTGLLPWQQRGLHDAIDSSNRSQATCPNLRLVRLSFPKANLGQI